MAVDICRNCGYADLSNTNWKDYVKCVERGIFVDPYSRACYRAVERTSSSSSGCFLTTTMCKVLGFGDDCDYLNTLRCFRDNYMKNDPSCLSLLLDYDNIGPIISEEIENDPNNKTVANWMLSTFITPVISDIKGKKYSEAIRKYSCMTEKLREYYKIEQVPVTLDDISRISTDGETLGKARTRKKIHR